MVNVTVTQTDVDILMLARDIISEEEHWCQKVSARDSRGYAIGYGDEKAVSFCSIGAVCRAAIELSVGTSANTALDLLDSIHVAIAGDSIPSSNDSHDHQFALDRFDDAIKMAKDQL